MGIVWYPTLIPWTCLNIISIGCLYQEWLLISDILNLLSGSVVSTLRRSSRANGDTDFGILKSPAVIFL